MRGREEGVSDVNAVGIFLSIDCVKACWPWRRTVLLAAALVLCIGSATTANAVNADPGDYITLPAGTNMCLQYLQFSDGSGLNIEGQREPFGSSGI